MNLFSFFKKWPEDEKITAVMITGKDDAHIPFALRSIQSFLEQTYKNKHLLIINDGQHSYGSHEFITEIHLKEKFSLGELRNMGLNHLPENSIWIQWDDDDWHHHEVMEKQYLHMKEQRADMCFMKNQIQYAFKKNTAWNVTGEIHGTIMSRKKKKISYPQLKKAEDTIFFKNYKKKYKTVSWDNPAFYYLRFIHGNNTWDENHFKLDLKPENGWLIEEEGKSYLSSILSHYAL